MNRWMLLSLLIMLGVIFRIFLFNIFLSPFIMVTVGLLLVFAAGEPVVDGFKGLAQYTGFPEHVIGIVQSIMLVFPLLALFVSINLDGYITLSILAVASTLWIVKKAVVDDGEFTLDEGVSILIVQLLGMLLFDELSRLI